MTHDMLGEIRLGSGGHFDGEVGEVVVAVSQTASTISQLSQYIASAMYPTKSRPPRGVVGI